MKFNIPFAYEAQYRHHRHRNLATVQLQSSVIVDIVEVAVPESPAFEIGCVIDRQNGNDGWQRFRLFDWRPARVWRDDGVYFAEYCAAEEFIRRVQLPDDNPFRASCKNGSAMPFPSGLTISSYDEIAAEKKVMEWYDDGGEGKAACIALRAVDMRVIEGMVCIAVSEPVVVVQERQGMISLVLSELNDGNTANFYVSPDCTSVLRHYRLCNLDEAVRYASRTARAKGIFSSSQIVIRHAEPFSSRFCQEGEHLYLTVKLLVWNMKYGRFPLPKDDPASVMLKQVLAETPEHHATGALADTAEAFLRKIDKVTKDDLPFPDFIRFFEARRTLEVDLLAWRVRPYSAHDFAGQALPLPADRRGFSQILSGAALLAAATDLRISSGLLEREQAIGNRLVRYHAAGLKVVVVTPALTVKCILAKYGRTVTLDDKVLSEFLAENVARLAHDDDEQALADIEFD